MEQCEVKPFGSANAWEVRLALVSKYVRLALVSKYVRLALVSKYVSETSACSCASGSWQVSATTERVAIDFPGSR